MINMKLLLYEIRREKGLSTIEMAKLCGIKKSTYNNYENGVTIPNLVQIEEIAKALDIPIIDLFESEYKL